MQFISQCTKVIDDLLFVKGDLRTNDRWNTGTTTHRCIHIPSLVISTQLPGGSLSLAGDAFAVLLPKCIMESRATGMIYSIHTDVYSIPACPPTHPTYCFIIERFLGQPRRVEWEVLEVEIDLSIPGPIKVFSSVSRSSRVSRPYTLPVPARPLHDSDDDLLLYLPLGHKLRPSTSLDVQFLRVGKPTKVRAARLGGVDNMHLSGLSVDRDAGYVIIWTADDYWSHWSHGDSYIWWLDERKPGNVVYLRTKELISSWSRGILQRV